MNICGIICEYNPFHNGHLLHIKKAKEELNAPVVCVMSGNYVQRGDISIMHKSARAEAAVRCGADLVVELPLPWSIATAELFAHGAVSLFNSLGSITHLSFGSECGDINKLREAAKILCSDKLDELIQKHYTDGISYATAREKAVSVLSPSSASLLRSPNNILAIEYLKALIKSDSDILPHTVRRTGAGHDEAVPSDNIASASLIRGRIADKKDFSSFMPKASYEIYKREAELGHTPISDDIIGRIVLASLKKLTPDDFSLFCDVSEGLEYRLYDAVQKSSNLNDAVTSAKTKRYALSRIRRCLLNAFLGVENSLCKENAPYARILAFNENGRDILHSLKKKSEIPIITKPASVKKEDEKLCKLFALENRADDIYSLFIKNPTEQGNTFRSSPIYVESY